MSTTFEGLQALRQAEIDEAKELDQQWQRFAVDYAMGRFSADIETIEGKKALAERIRHFGKRPDDLVPIYESVMHRRNMTEALDGVEAAEKEQATAIRDYTREKAKYDRLLTESREKLGAISARDSEAKFKLDQARKAKRELIASCRRDIRDELDSVNAQLATLTNDASAHRGTIDGIATRDLSELTDEQRAAVLAIAEESQSALSEIEPQIELLNARRDELEQQAILPENICFADIPAAE